MLRFPQNSLLLEVLVDCGADDSFIDSEPCSKANVPTETLPQPKDVLALNGQLLARVTHRTAPLSLHLSGNHHEVITLFVIPSPASPLVLGLPWLKLHNPHIDWYTSSSSTGVHFVTLIVYSQLSPLVSFHLQCHPNP